MYISHLDAERRERDRDLMRQAARERLVNEAIAGQNRKARTNSSAARSWERLAAFGAAVASLLVVRGGQPALPKGH